MLNLFAAEVFLTMFGNGDATLYQNSLNLWYNNLTEYNEIKDFCILENIEPRFTYGLRRIVYPAGTYFAKQNKNHGIISTIDIILSCYIMKPS